MLHDFIHSAISEEQLYILQQHIFIALPSEPIDMLDVECVITEEMILHVC